MVLTIVNPAAAGGRLGREWHRLQGQLESGGLDSEAVFTEAPGHAAELAARAVADGVRAVLVAGGDGTVCEAAEGLAASDGGCELAILPLGTGNDGARTLGVPTDLSLAARVAVDGRGTDRWISSGSATGWCSTPSGSGSPRTSTTAPLGSSGCAALPSISGLRRCRSSNSARPMVRIVADGRVIDSTMTILAVHNGPTTGGGFALTPDAVPDDGLLDATLVPDVPVTGRLQRLIGALRGTLHTMDGSVAFQAKVLELHHDEPLAVHFDGNQGRLEGPVTRFEIVPKALKVVVPG